MNSGDVCGACGRPVNRHSYEELLECANQRLDEFDKD